MPGLLQGTVILCIFQTLVFNVILTSAVGGDKYTIRPYSYRNCGFEYLNNADLCTNSKYYLGTEPMVFTIEDLEGIDAGKPTHAVAFKSQQKVPGKTCKRYINILNTTADCVDKASKQLEPNNVLTIWQLLRLSDGTNDISNIFKVMGPRQSGCNRMLSAPPTSQCDNKGVALSSNYDNSANSRNVQWELKLFNTTKAEQKPKVTVSDIGLDGFKIYIDPPLKGAIPFSYFVSVRRCDPQDPSCTLNGMGLTVAAVKPLGATTFLPTIAYGNPGFFKECQTYKVEVHGERPIGTLTLKAKLTVNTLCLPP